MSNTVGGVGYDINMDADVSKLQNTLRNLETAFRGLEKTLAGSTKAMDDSFNKTAETAKKAGKASGDALAGVAKKIQPSIIKLQDLEDKYTKISQEAMKVGNATGGFEKINAAMSSYKQQAEQGFQSTRQMTEATSRLNRQMNEVQQETNKYNAVMIRMQNSVATAEREVATLTTRMTAFGASEQEITPLNAALQRYKTNLENAGTSQDKIAAASRQYKEEINNVKNAMEAKGKSVRSTGKDTDLFTQQLQNSTKAVQLALGPLSGIAARISAFTSLVKTNTVPIAAFTAAITGIVVASNRVVRAGIEYERQMLNLEASIIATGRSAEITAGQLDNMARRIASATLTNATAARTAINALLTYGNLSVDLFEDIATAAQGMASAFGGDIVSSTRLLARALEAPSSSLDSLRRVGVQFTAQQKEQIRAFEDMGRTAAAQGVILDRVAVFQARATAEATGLAGQLDAVSDNFQMLTEEISKEIDSNRELSEVYAQLNKLVTELIHDKDRLANVIDSLSFAISATGKVLELLTNNFHIFSAVITGLVVGATIKMAGTLLAIIANMKIFQAETWKTIAALKSKSVALATARNSLMNTASATTVATAATGRFTVSLAAMRAVLFSVMPVVAGIAATLYVVSRAYDSSVSGAEALSNAHSNLTDASSKLAKANDDITDSMGRVNSEMLQQFRLVSEEAEVSFRAAERSMTAYFDNLGSNLNDAKQDYIEANATFGRGLEGMGVFDEGMEGAGKVFDDFQKTLTSTFNAIKSGASISQTEMNNLRREAIELGISMEVIDTLDTFNNLSADMDNANTSMKNLQRSINDGTIDTAKLFENITSNYSDLLIDFEAERELGLVRSIQKLVNETEGLGYDLTNEIYEPLIAAAGRQYDAELELARGTEEKRQATERYQATLSRLLGQQDTAIAQLETLADRYIELRNAQRDAAILEMAEEFAILEATIAGNVQRVDELKQAAAARGIYEKWINDLGLTDTAVSDLSGTVAQLKVELATVGALKFINLEDVKDAEDLKNRLFGLSEVMAAMIPRAASVTREMKRTPAKDLGDEFKRLASRVEEASKYFTDLKLDSIQDDFESVKSIIGGLNKDELTELAEKLGVTTSLTKDKAGAVRELTSAWMAQTEAYRQAKEQEESNKEMGKIVEGLRLEEELIVASYNRRREAILAATSETMLAAGMTKREALIRLETQTNEELLELNRGYWEEWTMNAQENLLNFDVMLSDTLGTFESSFATAFENMIMGTQDLSEAMYELGRSMVSSIVGAIGKMIAEWLTYKLVQMTVNKTAASAAGASIAAQASAGSMLAGINAYASTAAIPIFGPALAPVAMGTAIGTTAPLASAVAGMAMAFRDGGHVMGAGTGTSDSIPAWLSSGEFVMNAQATRQIGLGNLNAMNEGKMPAFATGGFVAPSVLSGSVNDSGYGGDVNVTIIDQSSGSKDYETSESISPEGRREIRIMVKDAVRETLRSGELDNEMSNNFGIKRRGISR